MRALDLRLDDHDLLDIERMEERKIMRGEFLVNETTSPYKTIQDLWDDEIWWLIQCTYNFSRITRLILCNQETSGDLPRRGRNRLRCKMWCNMLSIHQWKLFNLNWNSHKEDQLVEIWGVPSFVSEDIKLSKFVVDPILKLHTTGASNFKQSVNAVIVFGRENIKQEHTA